MLAAGSVIFAAATFSVFLAELAVVLAPLALGEDSLLASPGMAQAGSESIKEGRPHTASLLASFDSVLLKVYVNSSVVGVSPRQRR